MRKGDLHLHLAGTPKRGAGENPRQRRFRSLTGRLILIAVVSGCGPEGTGRDSSPPPPPGGTVTVGVSELGFLDPARAGGPSGLAVLRAACDGITALDPRSGRPEPALAKSWSFSRGAQKLSVELKGGLRFPDGTQVNSQAVRESLSRVARPATASPWSHLAARIAGFPEVQSGAATHLSGVKALSALRLEIELTQPFSDLPTVLAHPGLTPVSLRSLAAPGPGPEMPVCSGPYEIRGKEGGPEYRLLRRISRARTEPAPASGGRASPETIVVKAFDTQGDAYTAFEAGEVALASVPETKIGEAQTQRGFERQPALQLALLAFDTATPPLRDPRVRQAISLAVDRLVLIDATFPDQRPPALRWLPEAFGPESGPACAQFIRKVSDPGRAKDRLADAGPQAAGPIPLAFDPNQFGRLVAQAIQVQVKDVLGIDLELRPLDAAEFETSFKPGGAGMWLVNTTAQLPIPDDLIGALFGSGSPQNRTAFSDPEVDAAIEKARKAADHQEAARLWVEAENAVCDKMPAAPMWRASAQWILDPERVTVDGGSLLDTSGSPVLRALRKTEE